MGIGFMGYRAKVRSDHKPTVFRHTRANDGVALLDGLEARLVGDSQGSKGSEWDECASKVAKGETPTKMQE